MGSARDRRETARAADTLPQRTAAAPATLLGLQRLAGNRVVDALLTGAIKAPGTGFMVQRREENNAPLAEIQGLPMYDLLPRLAKLAEKVLSDEEAGGLVGGPRLVLAMQTVRAKMQRDRRGCPPGSARPEDERHRPGLRPRDSRDAAAEIIHALEARWAASLIALTPAERAQLGEWFPYLQAVYVQLEIEPVQRAISFSSPITQ
jgi:hypothetical protein